MKKNLIKNNKDENILINELLLNKYKNVEEIFLHEVNNYNTIQISSVNININNKNATEIYHIAVSIFKNNYNKNTFINDTNKIMVTNQDIKENINKIYNDRMQNKYLLEHLSIISNIEKIIKTSHLVNQTFENKNRPHYKTWNYYYNTLIIQNELYYLEFDVVSRTDGENHYRLQRLKKADTQSTLPNNGEVDYGVSASKLKDTTNLTRSQT